MTSVCEISNGGVTTWAWLCRECQDRRKTAPGGNWTVKVKEVIAWGCDDCSRAAQLAHGYQPPTVDFAPTTLDSRLPTAAECPPPRLIPPWPKPRKGRVHQERITEEEAA
jgi:hypothetical protein